MFTFSINLNIRVDVAKKEETKEAAPIVPPPRWRQIGNITAVSEVTLQEEGKEPIISKPISITLEGVETNSLDLLEDAKETLANVMNKMPTSEFLSSPLQLKQFYLECLVYYAEKLFAQTRSPTPSLSQSPSTLYSVKVRKIQAAHVDEGKDQLSVSKTTGGKLVYEEGGTVSQRSLR